MVYRISAVDGDDEDIADTIRELHDEVFGDTAPQVDPTNGHWWLAFAIDEGREIAGFCGLTQTYGDPSIGYLKRAGVRLQHRGQGLQRRFVRVREARARKLGMRDLVTDTSDNPSSANNLIACGYRIYRPPSPWGFPHTIYWTKSL
ncbi:MAG: GNAT family N-acetyltransferase [Hyphomicrobiales bacterium]